MQNRYSRWTYIILAVIVIVAIVYAIPNLYGTDPSIQISPSNSTVKLNDPVIAKIKTVLAAKNIAYLRLQRQPNGILLRFADYERQIKARDVVKRALGDSFTVALNLATSTPRWLRMLGATPMKYGLDLRGGVHFLFDVDVNAVIARRESGVIRNVQEQLREKKIRYSRIVRGKKSGLNLFFRDVRSRDAAYAIIAQQYPELNLNKERQRPFFVITANFSAKALNDIRQNTIDQTLLTLRNRINELGVSEPVVVQQGATRVAVDLPGVQDSARAKQILGGTATVEFHMVDPRDGETTATGVAPLGARIYPFQGRSVLLKDQVILTGQSITAAASAFDQYGKPAVNITLGGGGEGYFARTTARNVGKRMAIVFVEIKTDLKKTEGRVVRVRRKVERVISVATIQQPLRNHFQITGLASNNEAQTLALFLRAGALPTSLEPAEERLVGPSLGQENINRGILSLEIGMGLILLIMLVYYRTFGLFANIALLLNLLLLVALLSIIGAVLTLPGIAGIVLTVGMAVDANVLIYERIREELCNGTSPQAAIYAGYERAFSTIVDANVTTLIVAVVLFAIGTGAIRNFAVTLMLGLLTSMLTGITYTRALVNLTYGNRTLKKLSIGI